MSELCPQFKSQQDQLLGPNPTPNSHIQAPKFTRWSLPSHNLSPNWEKNHTIFPGTESNTVQTTPKWNKKTTDATQLQLSQEQKERILQGPNSKKIWNGQESTPPPPASNRPRLVPKGTQLVNPTTSQPLTSSANRKSTIDVCDPIQIRQTQEHACVEKKKLF